MSKFNEVWLVCSLFHAKDQVEFTVSQEAYTQLEDARNFCESRHNGEVYDLDDFTFVSEPDERGCYYEYKIMNIRVNNGANR